MNDIIVIKRRRNFEWQVRDQKGTLLMRGRERTRPAARYQVYRTLFMMLAVDPRPIGTRARASGRHTSRNVAPDLADIQPPTRPFTLD